MDPLRYYHYLSAAKVEMMYPQAMRRRGGRSAELSGGFPGLLQAKFGGVTSTSEPSVYEKLQVVEDAINRQDPPGGASWGESYIRERMKLYSAVVEKEQDDGSDTVLFAGSSNDGVSVVLGGSAAHMLLTPGAPMRSADSSFRQLRRAVGLAVERWRSLGGDELVADEVAGSSDAGGPFIASDTFMLDSICFIAGTARRSSDFTFMGYCEFLAKVICRPREELDEGENVYSRRWHGPKRAVLATPLYVAHVEADDPRHDVSWGGDVWDSPDDPDSTWPNSSTW